MAKALNSLRYLVQVPLVLAVLLFVPTNWGKLLALAVVWALTFGRVSKAELAMAAAVSVFFTGMNAAALHQGIFRFSEPDVLGMPLWELFMWGFYVLHLKRLMGSSQASMASQGDPRLVWLLALLTAAAFGTLANALHLSLVSGLLLVTALAIFRTDADWMHAGYLVLLGAAFEYTGVAAGIWSYPNPPWGGVPFWFVTMWGSVGLFAYRLVFPIVCRYEASALGSERALA